MTPAELDTDAATRPIGRVLIEADALFDSGTHLTVGEIVGLQITADRSALRDALELLQPSTATFLGRAVPRTNLLDRVTPRYRVTRITSIAHPYRVGASGTIVPDLRRTRFQTLLTSSEPIQGKSIWAGSGEPVLAGFAVEVTSP